MKMKLLMISILFMATAVPVASQTVAYSLNGSPVFSVSMPDGWRFESKPNPRNPETKRISGVASKGLVWFGVWVVKDARTLDDAYKYVQATARTLITDAKETKAPTVTQVNGMKGKYSEHSGTMKMEDGKQQMFNAQVLLFEAGGGRIGIAVCLADTEGQTAEKANIDAFFKSVKRAK